jgi:hypothetical protein
MKVFNVWLIVEEIDEENENNGKDINCAKFVTCLEEKQADKYLTEIMEYQEEIKSNLEG